jgi:hypothetical protein
MAPSRLIKTGFSRRRDTVLVNTALESAGVEFIPPTGGGAGLRLGRAWSLPGLSCGNIGPTPAQRSGAHDHSLLS